MGCEEVARDVGAVGAVWKCLCWGVSLGGSFYSSGCAGERYDLRPVWENGEFESGSAWSERRELELRAFRGDTEVFPFCIGVEITVRGHQDFT